MHLSIYVYRRLGLTLDLTEDRPVLPREAIREGPAFRRLTATPEHLQDPARLRRWLRAFLPENGAMGPQRDHAVQEWERRRVGAARDSAASILWGNTDGEYTGAIDFRQSGPEAPERLPDRGPAQLETLSEQAVGQRLDLADRIADNAPRTRPDELLGLPGRRSWLSGMRGKIGLARCGDGGWAVARGETLHTWIVKHEHRAHLPGEGGVEAIIQRTLGLAGIPVARTEARVFDGHQAVASERSDRGRGPDGTTEAWHQEEWIQAACHDPDDKYDSGLGPGPQWPDAYRLLQTRAADPAAETGMLTRVLASAWILGNGDQHRRNLGFRHGAAADARSLSLAPVYDASSAAGTKYDKSLALGMEGVHRVDKITPVRWIRHSRACGIAPEGTLAIIEDLFRTLPDALWTAREQARMADEVVNQAAVDRRIEATARYVQARERQYRNQLRSAERRRLVTPASDGGPGNPAGQPSQEDVAE